LSNLVYLAAFIPVIMGMGGNIGTQSSTIVVRGLATGRLNVRDIWPVVFKELAVGLILGLVYGLLLGTVAQLTYSTYALAIAVGFAVLSSMSIAALIGFVTTAIDIISVFFYFQIATFLLGI